MSMAKQRRSLSVDQKLQITQSAVALVRLVTISAIKERFRWMRSIEMWDTRGRDLLRWAIRRMLCRIYKSISDLCQTLRSVGPAAPKHFQTGPFQTTI